MFLREKYNKKLFLLVVLVLLESPWNIKAKTISSKLLEKCAGDPDGKLTVMVELEPIDSSKFKDLKTEEDRDEFIFFLHSSAANSQIAVISALKKLKSLEDVTMDSFWISNRLALKNVSCASLSEIPKVGGVENVREEAIAYLQGYGKPEIVDTTVAFDATTTGYGTAWGVQKIEAPEVWSQSMGKGVGVVVASVDTGVRYSHEALRDNWRGGSDSWYDGVLKSGAGKPFDQNGHGTHTMGTICGTKRMIGVAPGAKWIACRGCGVQYCPESALLFCAEWISCPGGLSPTRNSSAGPPCNRPRVVNNSWGGGPNDRFYNDALEKWHKLGIIAIFAIGNGNSGSLPSCFPSAISPGDQDMVISVGATKLDDTIAFFSSIGPNNATKRCKPEVSAPGYWILSSINSGDYSYAIYSGTSMAAPHVTGTAALLFSKVPDMNFARMLTALGDKSIQPAFNGTCKCRKNLIFPNNVFGYGRIDAKRSFNFVPYTP